MIDPKLEKQLVNCRKLLKVWQQFKMYISECEKPDRQFTQKDEANFLKIKSQVAILFDSFFDALDDPTRETTAAAQAMLTIVENCILLRQVQRQFGPAEMKKMEIEWHEAYLLINTTIGILEEKQAHLAAISKSAHDREILLDNIKAHVKGLKNNTTLHKVAIGIAVFVGLVILPAMGIYNFDFLNQNPMTAQVYVVARDLFRKTIMKNLAFQNWEVFLEKYPINGPPGYSERKEVPGHVYAEMSKKVETLLGDMTVMDGGGNTIPPGFKLRDFTANSQHVTIAYFLMDTSAQAATCISRTTTEDLLVQSTERDSNPHFYIQFGNVVYILRGNNPRELDEIKGQLPEVIYKAP